MSTPQPLVSVIVPCFNQGQYLGDALNSLLEQSFNNWECIIVDDGSTDMTKTISLKYSKNDNRFKYISQTNQGVCIARNNGVENASGTYILPLDADDYFQKNYIQSLYDKIRLDEAIKVVYGKVKMFGNSEMDYNLEPFKFKSLILANMIPVSGMFKKKDFKGIGGYDVNMDHGYEDWEFWINLLKNGGQAQQVKETVLYYRQKNSSRMTKISLLKRYKILAYVYHKHAELYEAYIEDWSKPINLNLAYGFYLGTKIYKREDKSRVKKFYEHHRANILSDLGFWKRKKILAYWFLRGKVNTSIKDVIVL